MAILLLMTEDIMTDEELILASHDEELDDEQYQRCPEPRLEGLCGTIARS